MLLSDKSLKLTKKRLEVLERLGLHTADELLSYYPVRYDIINEKPFETWQLKERVVFEGEIVKEARSWRKGNLTSTTFEVMAYDHVLKITIFNRPWAKGLVLNQIVTITGIYMGGNKVTAMNYDTKPISEHDKASPVYALKEGIQQRTVRDCVAKVFESVENEIYDIVPEEYIRAYRLLRKSDALRRIHFPENENDIRLARRTLKYEEFLKYFTAIQYMKQLDFGGAYKSPRVFSEKKMDALESSLAFALTPDQKKALDDILKDMSSSKPMYRLVQGDVGCGKTVVAALSLYAAVLSGYQAALLAPTEILARQHFESLNAILKDTGIHIEVLYSGLASAEKKRIIKDTSDGKTDILIGTHSILQDEVTFRNLGFVAADEQQRFGVEQRRTLREKGHQVDFLLMTATPIPRTLASTFFGDMDISTIETMPPGRQAPVTKAIFENSFRSVLDEVKEILNDGHQLYVICAAVEENEAYNARNVYDTAEALGKLFCGYHVGILHGRMSSDDKQNVMQEFYENKTQILVSTTVVEVGMNVVNATGMIIYDADRFGLSQLHQLRGRVQRGSTRGRCWLLTGNKEDTAKERLNVLVRSNNGFEISNEDLRLRGPGDILGTRQSGLPDFILGNIVEDTGIIKTAREDALKMIENQDNPDYAAMLDSVREYCGSNAGFAD